MGRPGIYRDLFTLRARQFVDLDDTVGAGSPDAPDAPTMVRQR
ncbi:hypothetical protein [Candidatus Frankia nodulisporulans]|nr:hypothetical protein [Candidatus Frankia nodulisporulans]